MQWLCSQLCYLTAANQRTIVEIELLPTVGWQWGCQPFSCRCSRNVTSCPKEICSTSLFKESIPTIPFGNLNHPLPARSRFLRAAVRSTCFALWLHHAHPFVAVAWKTCLIEISRVFGQRVMASRFVTMQWLCSQLCCEIAANQRTLVEIELLATVGWKWGCQPFSCRCSQNVTHCPKEICSTSLSKESIPTIPFGNLNHPLPARSFRFLRAAVRSTCFAVVASCPSLRCSYRKECASCREAECLFTELWFPRFVTMQWLCSQLCCEIAANQRTLVEIELLATVGWKWGSQPFSCRCSLNVTQCQRGFAGHVCLRFFFGNSKHPLPARSFRFLRAAAHSTSSAFCLHYACKRSHPFVEDSGFVSYAEKHRFGHGVVVSKVCYRILEGIFFPFAMSWRLTKCVGIELLATVGWQWGCQPFSCRCSQNVTHCRKEIYSTCLFSGIHYRNFSWEFQASTPCQKLQVPESGSTLHLLCSGCIMPIPSLQLQKRMCLMQRSRVFGHGVMASRFVTILWLCSQLCCEIAANQRTLVEIELLATVGWKWGCQPFSCRCSLNVTQCRKETFSTC